MDRRKTILFIGILYLVSSVAAGAICYTTSTGAGVNIADEKQDADTVSGQSEPETTPESENTVEAMQTENESEAVTSVEETETSAEPETSQESPETSQGEGQPDVETESTQENIEATQKNTETESTDNTEAAGNTESTVVTAVAGSEAETDTQVTSQEAWTNAKHYNARVVNTGTSGLNVRAGADMGADVVGLLREDEVVEVIDISGDWYHIRNGGLEGYSYYKYLELIEQP